jgi:aerobic-type carbon monoxide dehydrogenase small subunit (CoxS/CutS family)
MSNALDNGTKSASSLCDISLTVNGTARTVRVYPMQRLLDVLRHELGLTGTKEGCGEGECGSDERRPGK